MSAQRREPFFGRGGSLGSSAGLPLAAAADARGRERGRRAGTAPPGEVAQGSAEPGEQPGREMIIVLHKSVLLSQSK